MTETIAQTWARCRPYVEAALARSDGGHSIEDVAAGIEAEVFHFWPGERCAVVTEFLTSPRVKTLNFWLLGGDLKELLQMRPVIEAWAKAQGCTQAIGGGVSDKPGWERILAKAGYRPRWTIYAKELMP
jgi:hypothetical protein